MWLVSVYLLKGSYFVLSFPLSLLFIIIISIFLYVSLFWEWVAKICWRTDVFPLCYLIIIGKWPLPRLGPVSIWRWFRIEARNKSTVMSFLHFLGLFLWSGRGDYHNINFCHYLNSPTCFVHFGFQLVWCAVKFPIIVFWVICFHRFLFQFDVGWCMGYVVLKYSSRCFCDMFIPTTSSLFFSPSLRFVWLYYKLFFMQKAKPPSVWSDLSCLTIWFCKLKVSIYIF